MKSVLVLSFGSLAVGCASESRERTADARRHPTEQVESAEPASPFDGSEATPLLAVCVGPRSARETLPEEQRRRARISPDGEWIALACDDVGDNEAFRPVTGQPEPE